MAGGQQGFRTHRQCSDRGTGGRCLDSAGGRRGGCLKSSQRCACTRSKLAGREIECGNEGEQFSMTRLADRVAEMMRMDGQEHFGTTTHQSATFWARLSKPAQQGSFRPGLARQRTRLERSSSSLRYWAGGAESTVSQDSMVGSELRSKPVRARDTVFSS
eukprot:6210453-Pleurochrysis_carterae.AAC.3